jgi:hypothetical protein
MKFECQIMNGKDFNIRQSAPGIGRGSHRAAGKCGGTGPKRSVALQSPARRGCHKLFFQREIVKDDFTIAEIFEAGVILVVISYNRLVF